MVGVSINHGAVAERALQPNTNWAVHVLAQPRPRTFMFVLAVHKHAHVHLVSVLVDADLTDPVLIISERHPELKLAAIALPEPERMTKLLRRSIRTRRPL